MRRRNSSSVLFLGEIVLALLIFALSATVCMGLLFRAYRISGASGELNQAVFCAQNAAETFKIQPDLEKVAALLGGELRQGQCYVYYDKNWQPAAGPDAVFTMLLTPRQAESLAYADISLSKGADTIFELSAAAYDGGSGQ